MNPKCNMSPEERDEAFRLFSGNNPYEHEREILKQFPQYLFFRSVYEDDGWSVSDSPFRLCTCSACGYEFEGVRINGAKGKVHNEKVTCPNCGRTLIGKAVYKFKYDMPSLQSWIKTAVAWTDGNGALLIEAADARRSFNHDNLTGSIDWYPKARYYIAPGKIQMWKEIVQEWSWVPGQARLNWQPSKTVGDPFQPNMMGNCFYDGGYTVFGLYQAIAESGLKYCQYEAFFEQAMHATEGDAEKYRIKYLAWAALYPQMEMAVKWGLLRPIYDLITEGKKNANVLNWSGTDPSGFLRMDRRDTKAFIRSGMKFDELQLWRTGFRDCSLREFQEMENTFTVNGLLNLKECAERSGDSIRSCAGYIRSLLPACPAMAMASPCTIAGIWKDYLHMAKELGYDLTEKTVRMPKDLQERHDAAAELIGIRKNMEEWKKYEKRLKKLRAKYAFSLGGLSIVVPACSEDIVEEGRILHHCVGGYAPRHIQGKTTILFLRHSRRPERSFLTIELDGSGLEVRIRQIHGYRNEAYDREISMREKYDWFLNPWLEWVNSGSKRDGNGVPIIHEEVKTA